MKTTLEIPDPIFRKAKAAAAEQGIPLRQFVSIALADKLRDASSSEKPWLKSFGQLKSLQAETKRIDAIIEAEFGTVQTEDRD